tara:strand:- start:9128 stop:10870 length:1743 start_codon:yes stop_codon:yes gene_type:complete
MSSEGAEGQTENPIVESPVFDEDTAAQVLAALSGQIAQVNNPDPAVRQADSQEAQAAVVAEVEAAIESDIGGYINSATEFLDESKKKINELYNSAAASVSGVELGEIKTGLKNVYQGLSDELNKYGTFLRAASDEALKYYQAGKDTLEVLKTNSLIGASSMYDKYLKISGFTEENMGSMVGIKDYDEVLKGHEGAIYIYTQGISLLLPGDKFIGSELDRASVSETVKSIIEYTGDDSEIKSKRILLLSQHEQALKTFYFFKNGKSVMTALSAVKAGPFQGADENVAAAFIQRDNTEILKKFRIAEIQKKMETMMSDPEEIAHFITEVIVDVHDGKDGWNHAKYYGIPSDFYSFIRDQTSDEGQIMSNLDFMLAIQSARLTYYLREIVPNNPGAGSSLEQEGSYLKRLTNIGREIEDEITQLKDFINEKGTTDPYFDGFDNDALKTLISSMYQDNIDLSNPQDAQKVVEYVMGLVSDLETRVEAKINEQKETIESARDKLQQKRQRRDDAGEEKEEGKDQNAGGKRKTKKRTMKKRSHKKKKSLKKNKRTKKHKKSGKTKKNNKSNKKRRVKRKKTSRSRK